MRIMIAAQHTLAKQKSGFVILPATPFLWGNGNAVELVIQINVVCNLGRGDPGYPDLHLSDDGLITNHVGDFVHNPQLRAMLEGAQKL